MDTLKAFAMGEANRGKELMVFDWDKAARLIKESGCAEASAGLRGDWEWTGGRIFKDGKPYRGDYTYLASTWAVPEIEIDGRFYDCWKYEKELPRCGPNTKWTKSALAKLKEGNK